MRYQAVFQLYIQNIINDPKQSATVTSTLNCFCLKEYLKRYCHTVYIISNHWNPIAMNFRTATLTGIGAGIEYYDFAIFALFAAIIGADFFPETQLASQILYTFLIFALSYFVRPLGGFIFGLIGDKYGRKTAFFYTMLTLMLATFFMAILPSATTIGTSATVIFIILRCTQGLAIGGEIPTAIAFNAEHYPKQQGLAVSIVFASLSIGILLTSLVYMLLNYIPETSFLYGQRWRIAFFIGAILSFLTYRLRKSLYETQAFANFQKARQTPTPRNDRNILYLVIASIFIIAFAAMIMTQLFLFLPIFLKNYSSFNIQEISTLLFIGSMVMIAGCLFGGLVSDYLNKKVLFIILIIILLLLCLYFYRQIHQRELSKHIFATICFFFGMLASTYTVIVANLFNVDFRCRGIGLSYNLSYLLFSAPIPALSIYLIAYFQNNMLPPIFRTTFQGY